jgi:hypothetical protein
MAKRDALHEMECLKPTLQKLVVGKILRTSRLDRSTTCGQTVKKVTTTLIQTFRPLEELAVRLPWNRGWQSDRPLVAVRLPGPISAAYNAFLQRKFIQGIQQFKFRDHSEIFMDQGEERWCSLRFLTRIRNLSKVATID